MDTIWYQSLEAQFNLEPRCFLRAHATTLHLDVTSSGGGGGGGGKMKGDLSCGK